MSRRNDISIGVGVEGTGRVNRALSSLQRGLSGLSATRPGRAVSADLQRINRVAGLAGGALRRVATAGAAIGAISVAGAVAGFRQLSSAAQSTAQDIERISQQSLNLGFDDPRDFQAAEFAASIAGADSNTIARGLRNFRQVIAGAIEEQEDPDESSFTESQKLVDFGITSPDQVVDADGNIVDSFRLLELLADRFQELEAAQAPGRGAALNDLITDRVADELRVLLSEGSEGLREARREADARRPLDDSRIDEANEFQAQQERTNLARKGFFDALSAPLIPVFNELSELYDDFFQQNRDLAEEIGEGLGARISDLTPVIREALELVRDLLEGAEVADSPLSRAMRGIVDLSGAILDGMQDIAEFAITGETDAEWLNNLADGASRFVSDLQWLIQTLRELANAIRDDILPAIDPFLSALVELGEMVGIDNDGKRLGLVIALAAFPRTIFSIIGALTQLSAKFAKLIAQVTGLQSAVSAGSGAIGAGAGLAAAGGLAVLLPRASGRASDIEDAVAQARDLAEAEGDAVAAEFLQVRLQQIDAGLTDIERTLIDNAARLGIVDDIGDTRRSLGDLVRAEGGLDEGQRRAVSDALGAAVDQTGAGDNIVIPEVEVDDRAIARLQDRIETAMRPLNVELEADSLAGVQQTALGQQPIGPGDIFRNIDPSRIFDLRQRPDLPDADPDERLYTVRIETSSGDAKLVGTDDQINNLVEVLRAEGMSALE